ncbi:hypothetical protein HDU93_006915, partial [Gonapodya sp. JEL0774]
MPRKREETDTDSAKKSKKPRADWTPELRPLAISEMESALKDKPLATPYDKDQIKLMYSALQAEYRTFARYNGKSGWSWDEIENKNWEEALQDPKKDPEYLCVKKLCLHVCQFDKQGPVDFDRSMATGEQSRTLEDLFSIQIGKLASAQNDGGESSAEESDGDGES